MSDFEPHDPDKRLSDGREHLGESLERPVTREGRELGDRFAEETAYDGPKLGQEFAQTGDDQSADDGAPERRVLLAAFAEREGHRQHAKDHRGGGHQHGP